MPLVDPAFLRGCDADAMQALLQLYCREADVDVLALRYQPETWMGMPHPFLDLPRRPSPDNVSRLLIDRPYDELNQALRSADARSKLRRKEARLMAAGCRVERAAMPRPLRASSTPSSPRRRAASRRPAPTIPSPGPA